MKILYLYSNPNDVEEMNSILEELFDDYIYSIKGFNSLKEVIAILEENKDKYDILLTDIILDNYSPEQVYREIIKLFMPVIVVSDIKDENFICNMIENGVSGHIKKPVREKTYLRNTLRYTMARHKYLEKIAKCNHVDDKSFNILKTYFENLK